VRADSPGLLPSPDLFQKILRQSCLLAPLSLPLEPLLGKITLAFTFPPVCPSLRHSSSARDNPRVQIPLKPARGAASLSAQIRTFRGSLY